MRAISLALILFQLTPIYAGEPAKPHGEALVPPPQYEQVPQSSIFPECPEKLTDAEREKLEADVASLNALVVNGDIPKLELGPRLDEILEHYSRAGDDDRNGEVARVAEQSLKTAGQTFLFGQALLQLARGGGEITQNPIPGVPKDQVQKLVDTLASDLSKPLDVLKRNGIRLEMKNGHPKWSFSGPPRLNANKIADPAHPELKEAIATLISGDLAEKLADPNREDAITLPDAVILPPQHLYPVGEMTAYDDPELYRQAIQRNLDRFSAARESYFKNSKRLDAGTFFTHVVLDSLGDGPTGAENDATGDERTMRNALTNLRRTLGVPRSLIMEMRTQLSGAIEVQQDQLRQAQDHLTRAIEVGHAVQKELWETAILSVVTFGVGVGIKAAATAAKYAKTLAGINKTARVVTRAVKSARKLSRIIGTGGFTSIVFPLAVVEGMAAWDAKVTESRTPDQNIAAHAGDCAFYRQMSRNGGPALVSGVWAARLPGFFGVAGEGLALVGAAVAPKVGAAASQAASANPALRWVQAGAKWLARGNNSERVTAVTSGVATTSLGRVGMREAKNECTKAYAAAQRLKARALELERKSEPSAEVDQIKRQAYDAETYAIKKCGETVVNTAIGSLQLKQNLSNARLPK